MKRVPFPPFELSLDGTGRFGSILWAGLAPCPPLDDYCRRLRAALAENGVPFDKKPFSPHITLVRREENAPAPALPHASASMRAERVSLMRSERGVNGMIYTEIGAADADEGFMG